MITGRLIFSACKDWEHLFMVEYVTRRYGRLKNPSVSITNFLHYSGTIWIEEMTRPNLHPEVYEN